jgi:hypothetical protein
VSGYSGYHNFLHSETYISKRISFGKESPNKDDKFLVNVIDDIYGRSNDRDCQENQSIIPNRRENNNKPEDIRSAKCGGYFSNAYRCQNFNEYFKKNIVNSEQERILIEIEELKLIQKELFKFQMTPGFTMKKSEVKSLLEKVDSISEASLKALEQPITNSKESLDIIERLEASMNQATNLIDALKSIEVSVNDSPEMIEDSLNKTIEVVKTQDLLLALEQLDLSVSEISGTVDSIDTIKTPIDKTQETLDVLKSLGISITNAKNMLEISISESTKEKVKTLQILEESMQRTAEMIVTFKVIAPQMDKTTEMLHTLRYFTAYGIRKTFEYASLTEATELL